MTRIFMLFAARMAALDALLTGKCQNLDLKMDVLLEDISEERNHIWYASDCGLSRIVVQLGPRTLRLDGPPSEKVKEKWEHDSAVRQLIWETEILLGQLCYEQVISRE